jgi:ubiquitin
LWWKKVHNATPTPTKEEVAHAKSELSGADIFFVFLSDNVQDLVATSGIIPP